jgi:ribosomal protein S18 acetylase RimI-like enzyme
MITVRQGMPSDADRLARFAARAFEEAFGAENDPADMALYLSGAYGFAQQSRELADPGMATLVAEVDRTLAGFAQLRGGDPPGVVAGRRPLELWRFYVDRSWQGRGVAQALMDAVVAEAGRRGAGVLWLGVWERNARARAFYRKCGFEDVGTQPFMLGTDRQTDRIMSRTLP